MSCYNFISKLLNRYKVQNAREPPEMPTSDAETVQVLKKLLNDKTEELKLKEETIVLLEKELDDKDALIRHLQNEIDKFRQVVRPITQKIITKQLNLDVEDVLAELDVEAPPRIKRQAISAEPVNSHGPEMKIVKISKNLNISDNNIASNDLHDFKMRISYNPSCPFMGTACPLMGTSPPLIGDFSIKKEIKTCPRPDMGKSVFCTVNHRQNVGTTYFVRVLEMCAYESCPQGELSLYLDESFYV